MNETYEYYLDLSSSRTGVVLRDREGNVYVSSMDFSKFKTKTENRIDKQTEKLRFIADAFEDMLARYPASHLYMEGIFIAPNRLMSSEMMLKLHGMMPILFRDIPVSYVTPSEIKKDITGKGNAKKEVVRDALIERLGFTPSNCDESDALALFVCKHPDVSAAMIADGLPNA